MPSLDVFLIRREPICAALTKQQPIQSNLFFLALVVEAGRSFSNLRLLACIHKLYVGDVLAGNHHAVGEFDFLNLELSLFLKGKQNFSFQMKRI